MVLTTLIGELRLQKKIVTGHDAGAIRGGQAIADSGFEVMPALIGRVDSPKTRAECAFGEGRGAVFFPCGTVKEMGDRRGKWHRVIVP